MSAFGTHCFALIHYSHVTTHTHNRYLAKFPNGMCPALEHGDVTVCENGAIARYLTGAFPDQLGKYYGPDLAARAKIDSVYDYVGGTVYGLIGKAW